MIDDRFKSALEIISSKLNNNIKWALVGSTNMALQGIPVNPGDLDVVVRYSDLKKMKGIFSDYKVSEIKELKPFVSGQSCAGDVKFNILGADVQIFGEEDGGNYIKYLLSNNNLVFVEVDEMKVPFFKLEIEAQVYWDTGRNNKAEIIREFLKN